MRDKHPIHTTLSKEAMRILERYEQELGTKNSVLEKALLAINKQKAETTLDLDKEISKIGIGILKPLLGDIKEGAIFGIIGPLASGKTLLACAIVNDFLSFSSNKEQCIFISTRNKLSYIVPITNSLGMKLGSFAEELFLDICDIDALDDIFRKVQESKPKIVVIDDLQTIEENGSSDLVYILNSSGWRILTEGIRNQKAVCIVTSEDKTISRYCDIVIELKKANSGNNSITAKVIKNIGMISSTQFVLEIRDRVEIVPLPTQAIEIVDIDIPPKIAISKNGSLGSLKNIADKTFLKYEKEPQEEVSDAERRMNEIIAAGGTIPPQIAAAICGAKRQNQE